MGTNKKVYKVIGHLVDTRILAMELKNKQMQEEPKTIKTR